MAGGLDLADDRETLARPSYGALLVYNQYNRYSSTTMARLIITGVTGCGKLLFTCSSRTIS